MSGTTNVVRAQDAAHADDFDYRVGSPHLRHDSLREMIEKRLVRLVRDSIERSGACRVLEVGAGHGTFTHCLVDAGAAVVVTEASRASARHLERDFAGDSRVEVMYDESGEQCLQRDEQWDLVVIISVLHHIPDYVAFLDQVQAKVSAGGAVFTAQDPMYYPRQGRWSRSVTRAAYLAWRLGQGNYRRGISTLGRRARGVLDDSNPSDLVEYHVVRDGCDEAAIAQVLNERFDVEIFTYWSTQSPVLQRLFAPLGVHQIFGIEARERQ